MTALDLLSVVCAVLALLLAAAVAVLVGQALRAVKSLHAATELFVSQAVEAVQELREATEQASSEVDRIDDLLAVAAAIGDRVDSATDATYRALTSPVIRSVALASGTRKAASRLRNKNAATTKNAKMRKVKFDKVSSPLNSSPSSGGHDR
ncbi:MAG: hypothetical protein WD029_01795 [Microthrixaceae bacterium]